MDGGRDTKEGDRREAVTVLDPYQCITKCNRKYANECTEAYLANKGATALSEHFKVFDSLEVVWFNGNRLSRLDHLESNFRIREVYVQDNRLVSLAGIKNLKFLQVLMASNNQLRNLDKQLALLERFNFLQKLDLFDNPVAVEPDYRLRVIHQVKQVQQLDRRVVTGPERLRADEVVPNMDKVSAPKPQKAKYKGPQLSLVEKECFRENLAIKDRRRIAEEKALGGPFRQAAALTMLNRVMQPPSDPRGRVARERTVPTVWERSRMKRQILKMAGKEDLTRADVAQLAQALASDGTEQVGDELRVQEDKLTMVSEVGRVLDSGALAKAYGKIDTLEKFFDGPEAAAPVGQVADWLLSLEWPRADDSALEARMQQHAVNYKWSQLAKDDEALTKLYKETLKAAPEALRLEGVRSSKQELVVASESSAAPSAGSRSASMTKIRDWPVLKHRSDVFHQSFFHPARVVHERTGKLTVKVSARMRSTSMGG